MITLVSGLLVLLLLYRPLVRSFSKNLAHVILNQTLWSEEVSASERQNSLSLAGRLLSIAGGEPDNSWSTRPSEDSCSMIPSVTLAESYRRQRTPEFTLSWLLLQPSILSQSAPSAFPDTIRGVFGPSEIS